MSTDDTLCLVELNYSLFVEEYKKLLEHSFDSTLFTFMGKDVQPTNVEDALRYYASKIQNNQNSKFEPFWLVYNEGVFIGTGRATNYNSDQSSIEIGYSLLKSSRGCGLGKKLISVIVKEISKTQIRNIIISTSKQNIPSIKSALSAGFSIILDEQIVKLTRKAKQ